MEYNFKCTECGELYPVKSHHQSRDLVCHECGSKYFKLHPFKPLIYHPRLYIDWAENFKELRYNEIVQFLKNEYYHFCDEQDDNCKCKEKTFQLELLNIFLNMYKDFLEDLPESKSQGKTSIAREGQSNEYSKVIIKERALWSPREAITWYGGWYDKERDAWHFRNKPGPSRNRTQQRIDIDLFNIAIEIKTAGDPSDQFRDLLAECIRDRMVAGKYVIGLYTRFPTGQEQLLELYEELFKEAGIALIVKGF